MKAIELSADNVGHFGWILSNLHAKVACLLVRNANAKQRGKSTLIRKVGNGSIQLLFGKALWQEKKSRSKGILEVDLFIDPHAWLVAQNVNLYALKAVLD